MTLEDDLNKKLEELGNIAEDDYDFQDTYHIESIIWDDERLQIDRIGLPYDENSSVDEWPDLFVRNDIPVIHIEQDVMNLDKLYEEEEDAKKVIKKLKGNVSGFHDVGAELRCEFDTDKYRDRWIVKATCWKEWKIDEIPEDVDELGQLVDEKSNELYDDVSKILKIK